MTNRERLIKAVDGIKGNIEALKWNAFHTLYAEAFACGAGYVEARAFAQRGVNEMFGGVK